MSIKGTYFDTAARINETRGWWFKRKVKLSFRLKLINKRILIESAFSKRRNLETKRICNQWINNVFEKKSCRTWENEYRERKTWPDDLEQAKKCFAGKRAIENLNQPVKKLNKTAKWFEQRY
jgi:hypothetical protein